METTTEDIQLQSSVFNSQEENIISPITSFPNLYRLLEESQKSQFKNELIEKEFSPPPSEANSSVSSPRSKLLSSSEFVIVDKNDVTDFEFPEQPKLFITGFFQISFIFES